MGRYIKKNIRETSWVMNWIHLAQDRGRWWADVNSVIIIRILQTAGNFLTSGEAVNFSRRTLLHGVI
jgi:hypothetical protein